MIFTLFRTAPKALPALLLLWVLQGCAQTSTQSPPPRIERSPAIDAPGMTRSSARTASRIPSAPPPEPARRVTPPAAETEGGPYVHIVRWEGETLSLIALWYSASWQNWKTIAKANSGLDPDRIRIGDRILIPRNILKKEAPMPFVFIHPPSNRTPRKKTHRRPAPVTGKIEPSTPTLAAEGHAPAQEEIELFKPEEIPEEGPGLFEPIE